MYQRQRSCAYFIAPVGACVLAGILVSWYRVPGRGPALTTVHGPGVPVPRRRMEASMMYRNLAEERLPMILTGTVADRWPARKAFSTQFLNKKLKTVSVHMQEQMRIFTTFHDDKPLEPLVTTKWENFNVKVNATIADILRWNKSAQMSPHEGPFMYYSQDVATLRSVFPNILSYLQPVQPFIISNDNVQVNLWVGREGLVTHTHYDCTYNFFVQLQGRKKFTLFPPDKPLYLYPCLHPHYGHSQVDLLRPDQARFPEFTSEGSFIAEVSPGDVLVVPPFWFHHVETLRESVSVNVWSDAPEYALLNDIYSRAIPFEEDWSHRDLAVASRVYIELICHLMSSSGPAHYIATLAKQRYLPLVRDKTLSVNESLCQDMVTIMKETDWSKERTRLKSKFQSRAADLRDLLQEMPLTSTMEVCLCNYIEHLVQNAVGVDYVYPFIRAWNMVL